MNDEKKAEDLRKLFPVTEGWTYLYNGSIHPCPLPVGDAMRSFIGKWQSGGEDAVFEALDAFHELRERFAALIHGKAANVVITESTTAGINLAAQLIWPETGQNVVVTDLAFMSNTYPWLASRSAVPDVRFVESRDGKIHTDDLAAAVDENTAAVNICAVTVGSGFRYDLSEVYSVTRKYGVPLIVDSSQALGVIDIDVTNPPLEFLANTASKWLMGPAGIGFLHVADRYLEETPPTVGWFSAANVSDWDVRRCRLHEDATRFQGGIPNLLGIVGALAGLRLLDEIGREFITRRIHKLTTYAIDRLEEIGVDIWTPKGDEERAGIVFFRTEGHEELHARLKEMRIYCGSFLNGIRFDPTFYNTTADLDKLLDVVARHVKEREET